MPRRVLHILNGAGGGAALSTIDLIAGLRGHGIESAAVCHTMGSIDERRRRVVGSERRSHPTQQADERGLQPFVEQVDPGVDRAALAVDLDRDGLEVASQAIAPLEERDLVGLLQEPGAGEAGPSAADDGYLHPAAVA